MTGPATPAGSTPDAVRLLDLRDGPLSVDEVLAAVADPAAGGTVVFVGTVRDVDRDRTVTGLDYSAHPGARAALADVAADVVRHHAVTALAAVHRTGELRIGDVTVVVAASAGHRDVAFAAARELIDELKARVPVWKHQRFADGGAEWVGSP